MATEQDHSPDGLADEKSHVKQISDDIRNETLHDSALRGHVATDKCVVTS